MKNKRRLTIALFANILNEIANKLFPLIIVTFVARKLGVESFGLALYSIFLIEMTFPFIILGLNTWGSIAVAREQDAAVRSEKICNICYVKLIHSFIISAFLYGLLQHYPEYDKYSSIVNFLLIAIIAASFDISFVYFGLQRLTTFAGITIFSKLMSLVGILFFVQGPEDARLYAVLLVGANAAINILGFFIGMGKFNIRFAKFNLDNYKKVFSNSAIYSLTYILIFAGDRIDLAFIESLFGTFGVGLYGGSQRIYFSMVAIIHAILMVFYSEMLGEKQHEVQSRHLMLALRLTVLLTFGACVGVWFIADDLLVFLLGSEFIDAGSIFRIQMLSLFPYACIILFGMQFLTMKDHVSYVNRTLLSGIMLLLLGYMLLPLGGDPVYTAWMVFACKLFVAMFLMVKSFRIVHEFKFTSIFRAALPACMMGSVLVYYSGHELFRTIGVGLLSFIITAFFLNWSDVLWIGRKVLTLTKS